MSWIKCSDEMPTEQLMKNEDVLIHLSNGKMGVGCFIVKDGEIIRMLFNGTGKSIDLWHSKPTHWQPLPEPPL